MWYEDLWTIVWADTGTPVLPDTNPYATDENRGLIVFPSEGAAHAECSYLLVEQGIKARPMRLMEYMTLPKAEHTE